MFTKIKQTLTIYKNNYASFCIIYPMISIPHCYTEIKVTKTPMKNYDNMQYHRKTINITCARITLANMVSG